MRIRMNFSKSIVAQSAIVAILIPAMVYCGAAEAAWLLPVSAQAGGATWSGHSPSFAIDGTFGGNPLPAAQTIVATNTLITSTLDSTGNGAEYWAGNTGESDWLLVSLSAPATLEGLALWRSTNTESWQIGHNGGGGEVDVWVNNGATSPLPPYADNTAYNTWQMAGNHGTWQEAFDNQTVHTSSWTSYDGYSVVFSAPVLADQVFIKVSGGEYNSHAAIGEIRLFGTASAIPEPSTFALGLLALNGLGLVRWRRHR